MPDSNPLDFRRAALWLGAGLVAGFALLLGHVKSNQGRRAELETVREQTAVGDNAFYPSLPEALPLYFQGRVLQPAAKEAEKIWDAEVLRAGVEESGKHRVYVLRNPETEHLNGAIYFVKTGENRFLRLQLAGGK